MRVKNNHRSEFSNLSNYLIYFTKEVVFDSPALADFAIVLVNSLLNFARLTSEVFLGIQFLQKNCKQYCSSSIFFFNLVEMTFPLVRAS